MSKPKPFIFGVDIDGCLSEYEDALASIVEAELGLQESLPLAESWDFTNWPIQEKGFLYFHEKLIQQDGFWRMSAVPDAVYTLNSLADDEGVFTRIITHRLVLPGYHKKIVTDTVAWLDDNEFKYRDICFAADKGTVGADVNVDDAPHNHAAIEASGGTCILFDQLYNQHVDARYRAKNWKEVGEMVLDIRDKRNV